MKKLLLCLYAVFGTCLVESQSAPIVVVDNIVVAHEHRGWRVMKVATSPVHFNLIKGDLIIRINGKNAAETGPMIMASLLNLGDRERVTAFIERGGFPMSIALREIAAQDYDPVHANPFKHVASGFSVPDEDFKDIDGQPLTLEHSRGRWLLINFTGTWCPPCMEALPKVLSAAEHNDLSLDLLTVALNDKAEAVRRMQKTYEISTPIAMMHAMAPLPVDFGITTSLWTGQIPALVLIRPDGEVALIDIGEIDANHLEKTIECLMRGNPDEAFK